MAAPCIRLSMLQPGLPYGLRISIPLLLSRLNPSSQLVGRLLLTFFIVDHKKGYAVPQKAPFSAIRSPFGPSLL